MDGKGYVILQAPACQPRGSAAHHQLGMGADLDHAAPVHDHDPIAA